MSERFAITNLARLLVKLLGLRLALLEGSPFNTTSKYHEKYYGLEKNCKYLDEWERWP